MKVVAIYETGEVKERELSAFGDLANQGVMVAVALPEDGLTLTQAIPAKGALLEALEYIDFGISQARRCI